MQLAAARLKRDKFPTINKRFSSRTFSQFPGRQRLVLPKFVNIITQQLDVILNGILVEVEVTATAVRFLATVGYT